MADVEAIARCQFVKRTETYEVWKVINLTYGRIPDAVIHLRGFFGEPREVGEEVFLFVDVLRRENGVTICQHRGGVCPGSDKGIDELERNIVEIIRTGRHMKPTALRHYLHSTHLVARATLASVDKRSAAWKPASDVLPVLRPARLEIEPVNLGIEIGDARLTTSLDRWRHRAQTIVRQRWAWDSKKVTDERVQKELDRLVKAELKIGREAILLLRSPKDAKNGNGYEVLAIIHADPDNPEQMGRQMESIRRIVESGDQLDLL